MMKFCTVWLYDSVGVSAANIMPAANKFVFIVLAFPSISLTSSSGVARARSERGLRESTFGATQNLGDCGAGKS